MEPGSIGYSAPMPKTSLNVQMLSVVLMGLPFSHSSASAVILPILFAVKIIRSDCPSSMIESAESRVRMMIGVIGLVESEFLKPESN